jgi:hypothetical protein
MMSWPTSRSRWRILGTEMDDLVAVYKSCKIDLFWDCCHGDISYWAGFSRENKEEIKSSNFELCFWWGVLRASCEEIKFGVDSNTELP